MGERPGKGQSELVWPRVNFRARLRLFFVLLVVVPMIALAVVLFTLTSRSETGKADAGISAGTRTAFAVYEERATAAEPAVHAVAADQQLTDGARVGHAASAHASSSWSAVRAASSRSSCALPIAVA